MKKEKNQAGKKRPRFSYKAMDFSKKTALWGIIFLLPWLFGFIFFFLRPLVETIWYSLCDLELVNNRYVGTFNGLENFKYVLTVDTHYNQMLTEALINMVKEVPFQIFVALFIAILLNGEYKGRGFFRAVFVIPIILATGVATFDLSETSLAAQASESVFKMDWLTDLVVNSGIPQELTSLLTTYVTSIFTIVTTCGVQVLLFLSGLQAISPSLYEVAQMEGCTAFETFCKITLPMVSPTILVCLVYSMAESFANAQVSYNSTTTMAFSAYIRDQLTAGGPQFCGYSAAMSAIYLVVSLAAIGIVCGIVSKGVFYYD